MKFTAAKLFKAVCGMVVMLALVAGITTVPVLALSNGIYLATAAPHYRHPVTGVIEDSGGEGSEVLGQSMTESALDTTALVEVDADGNTFVTVRLKLMDNIQEPKFQVDGSTVTSTLMQEDYTNNTADFRMKVKSENSVIRCNMYVVPMGRDVVFYITVSNLQSGSGDFITSVKVNNAAPQQNSNDTPKTPSAEGTTNQAAQAETTSAGAENTTTAGNESSTVGGIDEFDASGNESNETLAETEEKTSRGNKVVWWIIGGIIVAAAIGGCVWYFCFKKKNKKSKTPKE